MNPKELLHSTFRKNYSGPVLILNKNQVIENVKAFRKAMPDVEINYAVKANPNVEVLRALIDQQISFDVASVREIELLKEADVYGKLNFENVLYSNPVRSFDMMWKALENNISHFVIDCKEEAEKLAYLASIADNSTTLPCVEPVAYIRLVVSNEQSQFPLTGKFGATMEEAKELIDYCWMHLIDLKGVTFHVGSQCLNTENWIKGIKQAKEIFAYMEDKGYYPDFLDLGGGYPIHHTKDVPSIDEIGAAINAEIADLLEKNYRVVAEPGRFIVSNAGHMLTRVVSTKQRGELKWVYLDTGVFHGLIEASVGDFKYSYLTDHDTASNVAAAIAGPSCDSMDIVTREERLPRELQSDDFIVVQNCGAYTTTYGTEFNGFPSPKTVVL